MKYRKTHTSRNENKRLDHKKARAAEAQAMRGDRVRTAHGMGWGNRLPQPPVLDESPIGKSQKKSKRKPPINAHCLPGRKNHGWMTDIEVITGQYYWNDREYKYERKFKLCVYCGREKTLRHRW